MNRLRIRLIDVKEPPQPVSLRSHVADLQNHFARNLLLDVQIVIFNVRRLDIWIDGKIIAFAAWAAAAIRCAVRWLAGDERLRTGGRFRDGVGSKTGVRWTGGKKSRVGQVAEEHILRGGVKENAESSTDHRLPAAKNIPRKIGARAEIPVLRLVQMRQSGCSYLHLGTGTGVGGGVKTGGD